MSNDEYIFTFRKKTYFTLLIYFHKEVTLIFKNQNLIKTRISVFHMKLIGRGKVTWEGWFSGWRHGMEVWEYFLLRIVDYWNMWPGWFWKMSYEKTWSRKIIHELFKQFSDQFLGTKGAGLKVELCRQSLWVARYLHIIRCSEQMSATFSIN